jgi:hypothetical protein
MLGQQECSDDFEGLSRDERRRRLPPKGFEQRMPATSRQLSQREHKPLPPKG